MKTIKFNLATTFVLLGLLCAGTGFSQGKGPLEEKTMAYLK